MLTRRAFMKSAAVLAAPLGCAGVPRVPPRGRDGVVFGVTSTVDDGVQAALERTGTDWLSAGDSVFVKVACNSANMHPATTSPDAVRSIVRALFERGAGRVLVGDQSGVMSVRLAKGNTRHSSTRNLMTSNGLLRAIEDSGAEPWFFDDDARGYDDGYVAARMPARDGVSSAWPEDRPPMIARIVTEVDHIVYLPRLASHCLTGYTHGHKLSVGWMRDDTRHQMHFQAGDIYEKYTELNYCTEIAQRLRLTLTAVDRVLVDGGPDDGAVALPPEGTGAIVVASEHLANHDAVSVQVLHWAKDHLARGKGSAAVPFGPLAPMGNAALLALTPAVSGIPWTSDSIVPSSYLPHDYAASLTSDRALSHAYALLGGAPSSIEVGLVSDAPVELVERFERARAAVA
jgi:uncharacterized protein (DUF362 family)